MLSKKNLADIFAVGVTFLLGFVLTILPLPDWAVWFRPAWVLLILMFWLLAIPHRFGVGCAWCVGVFMDVLTGTVLGLHALFFTGLAYCCIYFQALLTSRPSGQQLLLILLVECVYMVVHYSVMRQSNVTVWWLCCIPIVTTVVCWPWTFGVLRDYQRWRQLA